MTISDELKAKAYTPYLGGKLKIRDFPNKFDLDGSTLDKIKNGSINYQGCLLELRTIDQLTAKEESCIMRILKPNNDEDYYDKFAKSTVKNLFKRTVYTFDQISGAIQFLYDNGIDFEQPTLNGQTLIQAGIAIKKA